jgi:hypothetical protein
LRVITKAKRGRGWRKLCRVEGVNVGDCWLRLGGEEALWCLFTSLSYRTQRKVNIQGS